MYDIEIEESLARRLYRPLPLYGAYGGPAEVPWETVAVIVEMVDRSPAAWTARLTYEELREAGHRDIPEELVNLVMTAMAA